MSCSCQGATGAGLTLLRGTPVPITKPWSCSIDCLSMDVNGQALPHARMVVVCVGMYISMLMVKE